MKRNKTFLDLNPTQKLNPSNLLKKKWYELNFVSNEKDETAKALPLPGNVHKKRVASKKVVGKQKSKPAKTTKKKFVRPGTEFREKIIRIFRANEDENEIFTKIRNYYYIRHGVDTLLIAPLGKQLIAKIMSLLPKSRAGHADILDAIIEEMKLEYFDVMKRAIIEYALHGDGPKVEMRKRTKESYKSKMVYRENRVRLTKTLNPINKCLSLVIDLWDCNYGTVNFINVQDLRRDESYDVADFVALVTRQIEETRHYLATDWFSAIQSLIVKRVKKLLFQNKFSAIKARKFFRLLAIVMENNLQEVCERSLVTYTDFICNIEELHQSFRLSIVLGENETLVFAPSFMKIQEELLRINDLIVRTVDKFERIENLFVEDLMGPKTPSHLKPNISAAIIRESQCRIIALLEEQRIQPELRVQDFDEYLSLMNGRDAEEIEAFVSRAPHFDEYCDRINCFRTVERDIAQNVCGVIITGIYEYHREELIETLEQLARFLQNELISHVTNVQQREITSVANEYENISRKVLTVPRNTNELMTLRNFAQEMENDNIPEMERRLQANMGQLLWLFDYKIFTPLEIKQNSLSFQWYLKMPSVFAEHKDIARVKTQEYQEALRRKIEVFKRELEIYWEQVQEYDNWGEIKSLAKYKKKATLLNAKLNAALDRVAEINEEEISFEWERSQFPLQSQTNAKLVPHKKLFDAGQNFMDQYDLWMHTQVGIHEPSVIESEIVEAMKTITELEAIFVDKVATLKLTLDIKTVVEEFKTYLPIIRTLGNCGMRSRHWEQVSEIIGFPIKVSPELTLERVIEYGLDDYISRFEVISESATKENALEKAMGHMISEWTSMCFILDAYRDTGTFILSVVDDIQVLLDDHIIKTQTMKNSPYIKPFAKEIDEWESKLILLQEVLDDWLNVQKTWMFLEPIFASPDIQIQMPEEGRRFSSVDKIWKDMMKQVLVDTQVMVVIEIDKMSERLKKAFNLLVAIQKGLTTYLDKKRLHFPRFFFVSNDELLEILSETKDPVRIQIYLRKCFAGIAQLVFSENMNVIAMESYEQEMIELVNPIITANARGQVEKWLLELEKEMQSTMEQSLNSLHAEDRGVVMENILEYPGQSLHCILSVYWTRDVENTQFNPVSLKELAMKENETFNLLLIKSRDENLASKHKLNLKNILILKSHHIEVINSLASQSQVTVDDFSWTSQLRHEFRDAKLHIKCLIHSLGYGYEYLGNVKRLILTPLTERCYRTLFMALAFHLGGHITGPTCSGKTETIKDFANCMAKFLLVFNCSDETPTTVLANYFKGIAASGSWCCLDDIDRLKYNIMSIIAQQILTIQRNIRAGATNILLNDLSSKLDPCCAIFMTTNVQRQNCPLSNNLKIRFRPISIEMPDMEHIIRVKLNTLGFREASKIAVKLVKLYEVQRARLTPQNYYDYGLRTLASILDSLSHCQGTKTTELEVIVRKLASFHLPKMHELDRFVFKECVKQIFGVEVAPDDDGEDYVDLVKKICQETNKIFTDHLYKKVIEMKELLENNTSVIVVGGAYSGKTVCISVVEELLLSLGRRKIADLRKTVCILNPKAVTMSQLYGYLDHELAEWKDGIFGQTFRKFNIVPKNQKYLILDGPIDPQWMDNLNTVLDDNRKLCLSSGELLQLPQNTKLIFETDDLRHASPTILSRCGIIYFSAQSLEWSVLFDEWKLSLTATLNESSIQLLHQMVHRFCPVLFWFIRNGPVRELSHTSDANLLQSLLNLFECFMDDYQDQKYISSLSDFDVRAQLEGTFFFSCVWGLGGTLDMNSRLMFSELFHGLLEKKFPEATIEKYGIPSRIPIPNLVKPYIFPIPKQNTVFDYKYVKEGKGKWKLWADEMSLAPAIPRDIAANEIIITIPEKLRMYYLMELLTRHSKHFMLVGPTGTGKTAYIMNYILKGMDKSYFLSQCLYFCALTTAQETQETVMAKLEKRRKNVFGPSMGKKCVYFVDDVSIPKRETFGAQTPIELLRLWLDHRLWYDQKDLKPIHLDDLQFICSMSSENHSNYISPRFKRHFHLLGIDEFQDETLRHIFSKIILWHLDTRGFSKEFDPCIEEIVTSTLAILKLVKQRLFPTPKTIQYVFNIRDFSRVVQGVLLSVPEATEDLNSMRRMWFHEMLRTFSDRLVQKPDRDWLLENMCTVAEASMKMPITELMAKYFEDNQTKVTETGIGQIMFCDYTNPKADTRNYLEVQDFEELVNVVDAYLVEYNNMSKKPMNLIFFKYTIEHLSRICRIIKQPRNHALILGHHGTGRQSVARLAAHIVDRELFQIDVTQTYSLSDWSADMKNILRRIASNELHAVLLLTDHQIKYDEFLKDIHNLMLSGEIPNLFQGDDKNDVIEKMREIDKNNDKNVQTDGTPLALFNYFIRSIREQLHVVLCMSPDNTNFRRRIRSFPSILKCCTIDWFEEWPHDAYVGVGQRFLSNVGLGELDPKNLISLSIHMHCTTTAKAREFHARLGRNYLITPFSYLDLCRVYKKLLSDRMKDLQSEESRFAKSIKQIENATERIEKLQNRLKELEPKLKSTAETLADQTVKVQEHSEVVVIERDKLNQFEAVVNGQTIEVQRMQSECDEKMQPHLAKLDLTLAVLRTISPSEFLIVKNLKSPPAPIKILLEGVCILKDIKPDRTQAGTDDFWNPAKRLVTDMKFLESLVVTNKDEIPLSVIEILFQRILRNEFLDYEKVKNFSPAFEALLNWVVALLRYHEELQLLKDDLMARDLALLSLNDNIRILNQLTQKMAALDSSSAENQRVLDEQQDFHNALTTEFDTCTIILERANNLIGGIGNETDRWKRNMEAVQVDLKNHIGDVLLAAGMVTYLGPFTQEFRDYLLGSWISQFADLNINCSREFSLRKVLADHNDQRLDVPTDAYFVDSSIIVQHSLRWPLIIDPQGVANNWIKLLEKKNRLCVIRLNEPDSYRIMENSIQFGLPVLLEKLKEDFDPSMEAVLQKQLFKQDGSDYVKLKDAVVEYSEHFRLYITTELENPKYIPEIAMVVNLVNFTMTEGGLNDWFLSITIARERPDLESEKKQLNAQFNNHEKQLTDIERNCLDILSAPESVLENDRDVESLNSYYVTKLEIQEKQAVIQSTGKHIDTNRAYYGPIAEHATNLFRTTSLLTKVNAMYQYSLDWFGTIYVHSIDNSEKFDNISMRIAEIKGHFIFSLFVNVCQGLYDADKRIFAFLLAKNSVEVNQELFIAFLNAGSMNVEWHHGKDRVEEAVEMLSALSSGIAIPRNSDWSSFFASSHPYADELLAHLPAFQKLIVIRLLRFDRLKYAIDDFIKETLGQKFVDPGGAFDLIKCFEDSTSATPLLFIMSADNENPAGRIYELASIFKFDQSRILIQSMNDDDLNETVKVLEANIKSPHWLFIENIHTSEAGISYLGSFVEQMGQDSAHPEFRLWLSSRVTDKFSKNLLQRSVKMMDVTTAGLKGRVQKALLESRSAARTMEACPQKAILQNFVHPLCLLHGILLERQRFGPISWNNKADFSESDLQLSFEVAMETFRVRAKADIKTVVYMIAECVYGGRISDGRDHLLLETLVRKYLNEGDLMRSEKGAQKIIDSLSSHAYTQQMGIHLCAEAEIDVHDMTETIRSIVNTEDQKDLIGLMDTHIIADPELLDRIDRLIRDLPTRFDETEVATKFPPTNGILSNILYNEFQLFNCLRATIFETLSDLREHLKGTDNQLLDYDRELNEMRNDQVLESWSNVSYPSTKTMTNYMNDLLMRFNIYEDILKRGSLPSQISVSSFYRLQSYLVGLLQEYSETHNKPLEDLKLAIAFDEGKYSGFNVEGAELRDNALYESEASQKTFSLPAIDFMPMEVEAELSNNDDMYPCPIYVTPLRSHQSTKWSAIPNHVGTFDIRTGTSNRDHWIERGVAIWTQTDANQSVLPNNQ